MKLKKKNQVGFRKVGSILILVKINNENVAKMFISEFWFKI